MNFIDFQVLFLVILIFLPHFYIMNRLFDFLFWIVVSVLLVFLFGEPSGGYRYSFYFVSIYIPIIIATSWIINSVLIPQYLLKRKFLRFFLYLFYTIVISVNLIFILVFSAFILLSYYRIDNIMGLMLDFRLMPFIMYLIVLVYGFISIIRQHFDLMSITRENEEKTEKSIIVRSERKDRRIKYNDIMYIESMADYVRIFLDDGEKVITRTTISTFDNKLGSGFLRIHRSYIINVEKVRSYSKDIVNIAGKDLPVSRTYKNSTIRFLGEYRVDTRV